MIENQRDWIIESVEIFSCHCFFHKLSKIEYVLPWGGPLFDRLSNMETHIHHIAYRVEDIESFKKDLMMRDIPMILNKSTKGISDWSVNFIHPSVFGIQLEFVELPYVMEI